MEFNGINFDTYFRNYPDKKGYFGPYGGSYVDADLQKAMDALVRRGFSYPQIREGLKQLEMDTSEFPEEF